MIVASSSTVIFAHEFIQMMARYVLPTDGSVTAFQVFWGSCWFAVVKGWHMTEFAAVCLVLVAVLNRLFPGLGQKNVAIALLLTTLFAINDEYRQTFVPGRGGTWADVCFDVFGASLAGLSCLRGRARTGVKGTPESDSAGAAAIESC